MRRQLDHPTKDNTRAIELPDERMIDDMDPSTERRCPINRNNKNAKLVNIDVSDVIKVLKYMQEFLAFSNLIIYIKKYSPFRLKYSAKKETQCQNELRQKQQNKNAFDS
jgi:hypothetical protein